MLDEVYEVKEYLSNKPVSERGRYRAAYLIARWYTQEGCDFKDTRAHVYEWAKSSGNYIKYNVNDIVTAARQCKDRLKDNPKLCISEADINRIVELFDNPKTRLLALAVLCYAKVYANSEGEFNVSVAALSEWIGLPQSSVVKRYLPELEQLGYLKKLVVSQHQSYTWSRGKERKTSKYRTTRMRVTAPLHNAGEFKLEHNDIRKLYDEIFVQTERTVFNMKEVTA